MTPQQLERIKSQLEENLGISVDDINEVLSLDINMAVAFAERRGVKIYDDTTGDMIVVHLASHYYLQRKGLNASSRMQTTEIPRYLMEILNDTQFDQFAKECGYEE